MNPSVVFPPEAEDQLAELYRYIAAAGSAEVAARYTEAIVAYCEELAAGQARHQLLVRSPPCRTHRKPTGYAVFLPDDLG